jgi:hypothetical protein
MTDLIKATAVDPTVTYTPPVQDLPGWTLAVVTQEPLHPKNKKFLNGTVWARRDRDNHLMVEIIPIDRSGDFSGLTYRNMNWDEITVVAASRSTKGLP